MYTTTDCWRGPKLLDPKLLNSYDSKTAVHCNYSKVINVINVRKI